MYFCTTILPGQAADHTFSLIILTCRTEMLSAMQGLG